MLDAAKDYLAFKRFGNVAYVCIIAHLLCGLAFFAFGLYLRESENEDFFCFVDVESTTTNKKQVEQACSARYDQTYSSPLPLFGFVLLSIGSTVVIGVIYSLVVRKRVEEIESNHDRQTVGEVEGHTQQNRRSVYVFYCYFVHLVLRALFGIIFTVLQHAYFYPDGFDLNFSCNLSETDHVSTNDINTPKNVSRNSTSFSCENPTASKNKLLGIFVNAVNGIVSFIIILEVIYLWRRFPVLNHHSEDGWNNDSKFVTVYFLGKQYNVPERQPLTSIENNSPDVRIQKCTMDITQNAIEFYKHEVKTRSRPYDINYTAKTSLDDMYIDVIIHTERARHKFSKGMKRHEIYDVYMKVPSDSIRLEKIKDLFYPNKDTRQIRPRSILVIGRPGIGKTVLTEKLLHEWANEKDEFYRDKIVFFFKLRLFDHAKFKNISLQTFLQLGTRLDTEKIEIIYQKIVNEPEKAIVIFDGLDECNTAPMECLDQSNMNANDPSECMSGMSLFIKLVRGEMLKGATVLVTSRPTAYDFYSRLDFDRNVEIIGFTSDKIEEYVSRFCMNKNRSDFKQTIWNHINSSSELLNLCYIPVNCLIMCETLYECLNDLENDTNVLPKTLTELYEIALYYVGKKHQRNGDSNSSAEETLKKLQLVAFNGMNDGKLIFEHDLFNEQMKASGLLNHLSDCISQDQFCFTHLTIQEFLAARHVSETFTFAEIKTFILDHIKLAKWHLILQFISGLLSKKINGFPEESKDCISAFVEGLEVIPDQDNSDHKRVFLNYNEVCVMKCLREVNDEGIAKDVCETTVLNDVVELCSRREYYRNFSNELAAVTAVCKHMRKLAILNLNCEDKESLSSVQKRCIKELKLRSNIQLDMDHVFSALTNVNCTLKDRHTCTNLTSLKLVSFCKPNKDSSNMRTFFLNGHGSHLEKLDLSYNNFSQISKFFEMLISECYPKLEELCVEGNLIGDKDAELLWDALTKGLRKLTTLDVSQCELTNQCIPSLCKALQDERCQLNVLLLDKNDIGDDGACMLFEKALGQEHCKLTELYLCDCQLTDRCVPVIVEALQDEGCQLTVLSLSYNKIGDDGACMLFEKALRQEHCKLTELRLGGCCLTDRCVPALVEALQDERCRLTVLGLARNNFTEDGERLLRDVETYQICQNRGLRIWL